MFPFQVLGGSDGAVPAYILPSAPTFSAENRGVDESSTPPCRTEGGAAGNPMPRASEHHVVMTNAELAASPLRAAEGHGFPCFAVVRGPEPQAVTCCVDMSHRVRGKTAEARTGWPIDLDPLGVAWSGNDEEQEERCECFHVQPFAPLPKDRPIHRMHFTPIVLQPAAGIAGYPEPSARSYLPTEC